MASDIMTVANVAGVFGGGFMDYGRIPRDEIIRRTKAVAEHEIKKWSEVLATPDKDFNVRVVRGAHKQEFIEFLDHKA